MQPFCMCPGISILTSPDTTLVSSSLDLAGSDLVGLDPNPPRIGSNAKLYLSRQVFKPKAIWTGVDLRPNLLHFSLNKPLAY